MKIYISGKISRLPFEEVKVKFSLADDYLTKLDYETVNPLDSGIPPSESWQVHMLANIALLFKCDAIFLLSDWLDSKGAMIEKHIAEVIGLRILYQSKLKDGMQHDAGIEMIIFKVRSAIQEVTGFDLPEYAVKSRWRDYYFARMMFAWFCCQYKAENKSLIGSLLNKDHATVLRMLKKFPEEMVNRDFRELVNRVMQKLAN
jgi:hypothetical protein